VKLSAVIVDIRVFVILGESGFEVGGGLFFSAWKEI